MRDFRKFWSIVTKSDFGRKWVSTDPWRGFYEATPKKGTNWEKVYDGWATGDWSDAGDHAASVVKTKIKQFESAIRAKGGESKVVYNRTSNVFSTGYDVFVRNMDMDEAKSTAESIFR